MITKTKTSMPAEKESLLSIDQACAKSFFDSKKLVIFDLDGTLTETKSDMDAEMGALVGKLLEEKNVAVIGGGTYKQFQKQFVEKLSCTESELSHLFLFPTTSTAAYRYLNGKWENIYEERFSGEEREKIMSAFNLALKKAKYAPPEKIYGELIEDRGSQVTFSALGQDVVAVLGKEGVALKEKWTRENTPLKLAIAGVLQSLLPDFEVHAAGYTSIDVTRKGIDKEYGVGQIQKHLFVEIKDTVFIGDALFPGGNDNAALRTGVDCVAVQGPEETKKIIRSWLKSTR